MCKKRRPQNEKKAYILRRGKSGFTLVELSVVLALLAIITTMVATFSVFMNGVSAKNQAEYDFYAAFATLRDEIRSCVAENDVLGGEISIAEDGALVAVNNGEETRVSFNNGKLFLGEKASNGKLEAIDGISFESGEKLIKCTAYKEIGNTRVQNSFVISLRASQIEEVAEDA